MFGSVLRELAAAITPTFLLQSLLQVFALYLGVVFAAGREHRLALRREIGALTVGIGLAADTTNIFISIYKQRLRELQIKYSEAFFEYENARARAALSGGLTVIEIPFDLPNITMPATQAEALVELLVKQGSSALNAILVTVSLQRSVVDYQKRIVDRNELVAEFKGMPTNDIQANPPQEQTGKGPGLRGPRVGKGVRRRHSKPGRWGARPACKPGRLTRKCFVVSA
jgi:hypothetical protein